MKIALFHVTGTCISTERLQMQIADADCKPGYWHYYYRRHFGSKGVGLTGTNICETLHMVKILSPTLVLLPSVDRCRLHDNCSREKTTVRVSWRKLEFFEKIWQMLSFQLLWMHFTMFRSSRVMPLLLLLLLPLGIWTEEVVNPCLIQSSEI